MKGWKKTYQEYGPQKHSRVAILVLDKVDFKLTLVKLDKEGHSLPTKNEIHQKEIKIINLYTPYANAPNFINIL
jgi:hypothetical protein